MRQITIFKLEKEEYGVDITKVVEIVRYQEIRQIPDGPSYIEGVINLRGNIHPIYNLSKRFNMDQKEVNEETKIIIMRTSEMNIGFIVDSVSEILNIPIDDIVSAPPIINSKAGGQYVGGIAKKDNRIIVLLDIDQLVSGEDYDVLNKIIEQ